MQVKVYEITWSEAQTYEVIWDETQTVTGRIGGHVVTYNILFSDQGIQGEPGAPGALGPQGPPGPATAALLQYLVVTNTQTVEAGSQVAADTSGSSFTLTLPHQPQEGELVEIIDLKGTWHINPLSIESAQPFLVEGRIAATMLCNVQFGVVRLVYSSAQYGWKIIPLPRHSSSGRPLTSLTTRFAVVGDGGDDASVAEGIAQEVASAAPDFVVHVGDINQLATAQTSPLDAQLLFENNFLQFWTQEAPQYVDKIYLAFGNHDLDPGDYGQFLLDSLPATREAMPQSNRLSRLYCYDFVQGPVHFFVLNSGNTSSGDSLSASADPQMKIAEQVAQLTPAIHASSAPWKVVVIHKPPYTGDIVHEPGSQAVRDLWDWEELGINMVLSGHGHTYEIWRDGSTGPHYFVNGMGGAPLRGQLSLDSNLVYGYVPSGVDGPMNSHGFMLVEATLSTLLVRFITASGQEIHNLSIERDETVLSLSAFYAPMVFTGASNDARGGEGFVPAPSAGEQNKFLRGDGTWQPVALQSSLQRATIEAQSQVTIDAAAHDTFVFDVEAGSVSELSIQGFALGKTIFVCFLPAFSSGQRSHVFPLNTFFNAIGNSNTVYSFSGHATCITLQNIGSHILGIADVVKLPTLPPSYSSELLGLGIDLLP
jgi:hypothetical protein